MRQQNIWAPAPGKKDATALLQTNTAANLVVFLILGLSVAILLMSLSIEQVPRTIPGEPRPCANTSLVLNTSECGSSDCMLGFIDTQIDQCLYFPAPAETPCTSGCYKTIDPVCNGQGECVGEICRGECTMPGHCPSIISEAAFDYDSTTAWTFSSWYSEEMCLHSKCVYIVVDIYAVSSPNRIAKGNTTRRWRAGAARVSCLDYVDDSIRVPREKCLVAERYLLTPDIIDYDYFSNGNYGNETFPFQLSVCLITYNCSRTVLQAATASTSNLPLKTMRDWGFLPLPETNADVAHPFLGIENPFDRNRVMSEISSRIVDNMPLFAEHVNSQMPVPVPEPVSAPE